jgi:hypothetical protein
MGADRSPAIGKSPAQAQAGFVYSLRLRDRFQLGPFPHGVELSLDW